LLRRFYLHGSLSAFGGPYDMDIHSIPEGVKGLSVQLRGLREAISEGTFKIICSSGDQGFDIDEKMLPMFLSEQVSSIHIIPVPAGSKSGGGVGKIVIGVALIAAAFVFSPAALPIGITIALAGVVQVLSPSPSVSSGSTEKVDQNPSFLFNGAINTSEQGGVCPIVYGEMTVGSVVVSSGIEVEQVAEQTGTVDIPSQTFPNSSIALINMAEIGDPKEWVLKSARDAGRETEIDAILFDFVLWGVLTGNDIIVSGFPVTSEGDTANGTYNVTAVATRSISVDPVGFTPIRGRRGAQVTLKFAGINLTGLVSGTRFGIPDISLV